MKLYQNYFCLILLLCFNKIQGQEFQQTLPLSPNAASVVKYGETPVDLFTGIPNINIPLYSLKSGSLNLPISLNYHASGNKVESIASWVGLGWSLSSIPSISRSVRGLPDESSGGYFALYSGNTVKELWEMSDGTVRNAFRAALYHGDADSEPDIFYYNLPEESGKFFYNQESGQFITFPKSNLKIIREGNDFRLITESGVEYSMNVKETTNSNDSNPVTSSWFASNIISPSKKDSIKLYYALENQITKTKNVITKYHYLAGLSIGLPADNGAMTLINSTSAMVVDSIVFKNGYMKFERDLNAFRGDLQGGHSLEKISVYDKHHKLVRQFKFVYNYIQGNGAGSSCYNVDSYTKKWMFLDKIHEIPIGTSNSNLSHDFSYNLSSIPPCRTSAAQDYWGFYNGKNYNTDLTPSYFIPNTNPPQQVSGADRSVNPVSTKFGILSKITYPTGGFTEFDFENNTAYSEDLPPDYVKDYVSLAGEEFFDVSDQIPTSNYFEKNFSVQNISDPVLNNSNPNGGAVVSFTLGLPGCDLSQGANPCALFKVVGLSVENSHVNYSFHLVNSSLYLPNGDYKLTASFSQSPPQYRDFYFIAEWDKIDPTQSVNMNIGGLRIREVRNFSNSASSPVVKKYKYSSEYNSTISSGESFVEPNFSHSDIITYYDNTHSAGGSASSLLLRVRSKSNMQQVTQSGSFVGYRTIYEESNHPDETGYTEYQYSHVKDDISHVFPYPPSSSREIERGNLIQRKIYGRSGSIFRPLRESSLEYSDNPFNNSSSPKNSTGIKWGNLEIFATPPHIPPTAQNLTMYLVRTGWNEISKEVNKEFYDDDSIQFVTNHFYDNPSHLLKTRIETFVNNTRKTAEEIRYPQDIENPSSSILALVNQNRLNEKIEAETYRDIDRNGQIDSDEILQTQRVSFKTWYPNIVEPQFSKSSKSPNLLKVDVQYLSYYDNGKIREIKRKDGITVVYIWGYNEEYPIAKIENTTFSEVSGMVSNLQHLSNLDDDNTLGSFGNEGALRNQLNSLRTNLPNAMVTTYTYDPLVGVTSITDPKGYTIYYQYDDFNRLSLVKDQDGDILSENRYHYKDQASN